MGGGCLLIGMMMISLTLIGVMFLQLGRVIIGYLILKPERLRFYIFIRLIQMIAGSP